MRRQSRDGAVAVVLSECDVPQKGAAAVQSEQPLSWPCSERRGERGGGQRARNLVCIVSYRIAISSLPVQSSPVQSFPTHPQGG